MDSGVKERRSGLFHQKHREEEHLNMALWILDQKDDGNCQVRLSYRLYPELTCFTFAGFVCGKQHPVEVA
jgi:hypothetical protein